MADPKETPATPPTPKAELPKSAAPTPAPTPKPPAPPPAKKAVALVEPEPTLRDEVASKLQAMLRSDSYRERQAIANSVLDLFPE